MTCLRRHAFPLLACLGLAAAVAAVYGQAVSFPFLALDDRALLRDNPALQDGLTAASARWAFTTDLDAGRVPVTWLSRLLDVELFGMAAGMHHLMNVLLHGANAVLLFLFLLSSTGRRRESAFAAALFAVHPLNVSAVSWTIERKEVLCLLFVLLTLHAYVRYARSPRARRMAPVLLLFLLALLSKPTAVTLPFVLLLLDAWPLGRLRLLSGAGAGWVAPAEGGGEPGGRGEEERPFPASTPARLLAEKAPLFVLSAAASAVTWLSEAKDGVLTELPALPLRFRLANAAWSYAAYLRKALWPSGLSFFYPHPGESLPGTKVAAALLLLAAVTATVAAVRRRAPFLLVGWLWFLGALVPVIGIVQAGSQGMADHYAYYPGVGLWVCAAWGGAWAVRAFRPRPAFPAALAFLALAALGGRAFLQARDWGAPERLFRRALVVTEGNWMALESLGILELDVGRLDAAAALFREALRIHPGAPEALNHLGIARARAGRFAEAEQLFREEAARSPRSVDARYNLAIVLWRRGDAAAAEGRLREALLLDPGHGGSHALLGVLLFREGKRAEAEGHFLEAVRARPRDPEANNYLGVYLSATGREREALERYRAAVRYRPWYAEGHHNLGMALLRVEGKEEEAVAHLREALRIDPGLVEARNNLGVLLARNWATASSRAHLREALRIDPGLVEARNNLGVLLARRGAREEAVAQFREALRLRPDHAPARRNLEKVLAGGAGKGGEGR